MSKEKKCWLMKSEPAECSIQHLAREGKTWWTGVRNYQARNFMMNEMQVGDTVLFYHSNAEPPGIAGLAEVSKPATPDPTQFDPHSDSFEPKATQEKPVWFCVQIKFIREFPELIPLAALRDNRKLTKMQLLRPGQRLSIQPVLASEFENILKMADENFKENSKRNPKKNG